MAVVVLVSAKGSPGVTTSALALTLTWPQPVVLAEADPAGGDLAAGYLAGNQPAGGGMLSLALALRRGALPKEAVRDFAVVLDDPVTRLLLPSPLDPVACRPIREASEQLLGFFAEVAREADVLVDAGRLDADGPSPALRHADAVLLALRPTLRAVAAAQERVSRLRENIDPELLALLLVGDRGPYGAADVETALSLRCAAVLADDAGSAAMLHGERPVGRALARGALLRSARVAAEQVSVDVGPPREPMPDGAEQNEVPVASMPERVG